ALLGWSARQKRNERKAVAQPRLVHHRVERLRASTAEVVALERALELLARAVEKRRARPDAGPRAADGTGRHERPDAVALPRDPSRRHANGRNARVVDLEREGAAEVDGGRRRRVDRERARRRRDLGLEPPALEREAMAAVDGLFESKPRAGLDGDGTESAAAH